ncbi:MAG TPA: hypothetical protein PLZ23_00910 [Candidatus Paceibacterota bacterium]|jgi:hypothetical protein|nr:hypothetical protein [Candidatus Paceibacterota bacterium]HPY12917.1 hypothetical protein [Candidatus Paceibacterota bacterium]HQF40771.1 hypothetical protein [Candidatus Paceibacterota bacterium]HQJ84149.1 hypothetical protein [Candidatus Paceibacterota bacterium]
MEQAPKSSGFTSRLEAMQKKIYRDKPDEEMLESESTLLPKKKFGVKTDWDIPAEETKSEKKPLTSSFLFRTFLFSVVFFILALGVAAYLFFYGFNTISSHNIEMKIQGPSIVKAGDEINLQATITNNNKAPLDSVSVIFSYPVGTLNALDRASAFPVDEQEIGGISEKQVVNVSSRAIIFGERNSEQEVVVTMEYRLPDSNAIYTKEKTFTLVMGASPIDLSLDLPSELNAGQEFPLVIKLVSNSETVLKNINLTLEYPATGFMLKNAEPEPLAGGSVWFLGDIPAGSERVIKINGILEGQNEDVKSFRVRVSSSPLGSPDEDSFDYGEAFAKAVIKRSFINFGLSINGSTRSEVVIRPRDEVSVSLNWGNNLPDRLFNNRMVVKLDENLIDKRSVVSNEGFYNSIDNTITWDRTNTPGLSELDTNEIGNSFFKFKLLDFSQEAVFSQPSFGISAFFEGQRVGADQLSEKVTSDSQRLVKIETEADFSARSIHSVGPFKNSGPVPPRVGQDTSYTIVWSITNTTNTLNQTKVKTTLPAYVNWTGSISPPEEKIIYDPNTREVSWQVGEVSAGTGETAPVREAYFQVSITPSLSQVGQLVRLTNQSHFQATDSFTNTIMTKTGEAVTTDLTNDPKFGRNDQLVTE